MRNILSIVYFLLAVIQPIQVFALQTKGQNGSTWNETLRIQAPSNQITTVGDKSVRVETGNGNILGDPGFERTSGASPWSAVTWTGAPATINTIAANNYGDSLQSMKIDVTADYSVAFLRQDVTLKGSYAGQTIEHGMWFKTTNLNLMQICARQNGARVGVCFPYINLTGEWEYQYATSIATSSTTSLGIELAGTGTGNMTGSGYADEAYVGPFRWKGSTNLTGWKVDATISGGNPSLGTSAVTTYTGIEHGSLTLTNNTGSGNITAMIGCSGTNAATGTTCSSGNESVSAVYNQPYANQDVRACASFGHNVQNSASSNIGATFQIVETTNSTQTIIQEGKSRLPSGNITVSSNLTFPNQVCGTFTFTSSGQKTLRLAYEQEVSGTATANQILADALGVAGQRDIHWEIYPLSGTADTAQSTNAMRAPNIREFTSGSGTYTPTVGTARIEYEFVGGGGGGAGGGSTPQNGTAGGDTTFAGMTAGGGTNAIDGGTATCGGSSYTQCTAIPGGRGGRADVNNSAGVGNYPMGASGGNSPFGFGFGGGTSGANTAGLSSTGYGGGGGGGGTTSAVGVYGGQGGGGGAGIKGTIVNPSSSGYSYSIGSGGSGGTAITNGLNGGPGTGGYLRIIEYFGINVPPMKAGVIAQDNPGGVTTINTVVSKSADYTATINEDMIVSDSSGANRTIAFPAAASVKGKRWLILNSSASNRTILDPNGSETICGQSQVSLIGAKDKMWVFSDGTNLQSDDCERVVNVTVGAGGACTTGTCSSSGVGFGNVNWNSTGNYTANFATGAFSAAPYSCNVNKYINSAAHSALTDSLTSSSVIIAMFVTTSGAAANSSFMLSCKGPR